MRAVGACVVVDGDSVFGDEVDRSSVDAHFVGGCVDVYVVWCYHVASSVVGALSGREPGAVFVSALWAVLAHVTQVPRNGSPVRMGCPAIAAG